MANKEKTLEYECLTACFHKNTLFRPGEILKVDSSEDVPRHFKPLFVIPEKKAKADSKASELAALKVEAKNLGIDIKGNWGVKAIKSAIEKAKATPQEDDDDDDLL